jgi:two-component system sensor kinase FixL
MIRRLHSSFALPMGALPMRALIPLLTGIGGIIVLLVFTFFQWRNALQEVEEEATRDVSVIMSNLHASVSYLLRKDDIAGVQTVLTHQGFHRQMKHLLLSDQGGRVLAGKGSAIFGSSLESVAPELIESIKLCWDANSIRTNPQRSMVIACAPVALPVDRAGQLRAGYILGGYDLTGLKAEAGQRAARQIGVVWLLFGAGFIVMFLLVHHALARRRITQVVAVTDKIAAGDLHARVGIHGGDELATIGKAVDHMADQLESARRRLQDTQDELEQRVIQRTAELGEINQALEHEIQVRKRAEVGLRREEAWLRSLIQTSQDGIVAMDGQGRIILFNPSAERMFGWAAEEVTGKTVNLLMPDTDAAQHDRYVIDYQRTGEAHAIGRVLALTAKRKSGESFPVEISLAEINAENDIHYAAFIRDMSERTRLQAQLLENERLAAIGTTAAKIGHEIANPLNGMYLTVQLLEQQLAKEPTAANGQISANFKKIRDEIARLNQLVQQFRTISRREKYDVRPLNLAELINDLVAIQQPLCADAGISIEAEIEGDLPAINADRDKMMQALLNLVKNSTEATPRGGKIAIRASASPNTVTIQVADTGSGIPAGMDIFQPFATTKAQGTGIGLVVVRQIVTAHGGTVAYASDEGKGTTFTISLPRR